MEVASQTSIEGVLVAKRYEILETFVQRVRRLELAKATISAADLARPIAALMTWMARSLGGLQTEPTECARLAYDYADDRRRMGYELPAMLTELGLLRGAIVDVAADCGIRDPRETERAAALLHRVLVETVTRASSNSAVATSRMAASRRTR